MTTTISSSALDFNAIKNNLKTYFEQQPEFADYNFEGAALSNILDVLAYNTHINSLTANFATNEAFLGTAQLRSSLVSLSEAIGYVPSSAISSNGVVTLSLDLSGVSGRPNQIFLPAYIKFTGNVDGVSYVFQTLDDIQAVDDGSGTYIFETAAGSQEINIYEGSQRTKTFLVGSDNDNVVYVIPDEDMDINTASVAVFNSATSAEYSTYSDFRQAISISDITRYYVLRESPNGYFDLTFGNGTSLGEEPVAGNKIEVIYLSTHGSAGNDATVFVPMSDVTVSGVGTYPLNVVTINKSFGGQEKEGIESIRFNAPYVYAAQNRMVTARDYSSIILERFPSLISDIIAWGGEDNIEPQFGVTFLSVLFNTGVTEFEQETTKNEIREVAEQLSVMSFGLEFTDPITTYIEVGVTFDFNPSLTTLPLNAIQTQVRTAVKNYFDEAIGKFDQSFRRSNLLSAIDDVSPSVLSSAVDVAMQQRIVPILSSLNDFEIRYPVPIINPDDVFFRLKSTSFTYNDKSCILRNKLSSNVIQVINVEDNEVLIDNIGSYDATAGKVYLVGFAPQAVGGGVDYIKISCTPANSNTITPENNNILFYDEGSSFVSGTIAS